MGFTGSRNEMEQLIQPVGNVKERFKTLSLSSKLGVSVKWGSEFPTLTWSKRQTSIESQSTVRDPS